MEDAIRRHLVMLLQLHIEDTFDTSSSGSDDDNETFAVLEQMNKRRKVCRVLHYVEDVVPALTTQEFKAHFRMLPETFGYLLSILEPQLRRDTRGRPMICARKQCLLALWRLATPGSLRSISERFNVGRSTALYATRRVVNALIKLALHTIKWPINDDVNQVWTGFEATSGFPKVIGAIDGTHINIPAPRDNPEAYINRKGHHSIQLQAVCDHMCRFNHCYFGHVGSVHDQRVFRQSEVQTYLGNQEKFPQDCHLVGDLAYKLHGNLLTPYRDNGHLTERQRNYNFSHASARIAIEIAFGLLKGCFRSLLTTLPLDRVDLVPNDILACCVLHNICLMKGDDLNIEENEQDGIIDVVDNIENVRGALHAGAAKRDLIAERIPI